MVGILQEAQEIINGSRQEDYGDVVENFNRIADLASLMGDKHFSPIDCCIILMAVKLARQRFKPKRDNLVDLCGYAEILQQLHDAVAIEGGE